VALFGRIYVQGEFIYEDVSLTCPSDTSLSPSLDLPVLSPPYSRVYVPALYVVNKIDQITLCLLI
jgi:hypothetical protein